MRETLLSVLSEAMSVAVVSPPIASEPVAAELNSGGVKPAALTPKQPKAA